MMPQTAMSDARVGGRLSKALAHGFLVFVAGAVVTGWTVAKPQNRVQAAFDMVYHCIGAQSRSMEAIARLTMEDVSGSQEFVDAMSNHAAADGDLLQAIGKLGEVLLTDGVITRVPSLEGRCTP